MKQIQKRYINFVFYKQLNVVNKETEQLRQGLCFSQIKLIEEAVLNQKLKSQINKIQANSFSNLKAEVKKQDDKKVTELENKIETINLKLANISNHFSSQQNTPFRVIINNPK